MKSGSKLKSATCDTEIMVIKAGDVALTCGGAPMAPERPAERTPLDPAFAEGTKLGKRYVNTAGTVEFLCVKPGQGSLAIDGTILGTKDAKPLPSSD
jgi:hypothetical protein